MERSCGILLPISALPSRYGIGTFGQAAYDFADFLAAAGHRVWQLLPMGPTGYGDSPYSSFSTFAGNPYFIDPELLAREGLLTEEELSRFDPGDGALVDYGRLYALRFPLLECAYRRGWESCREEVETFAAQNPWLADYALFMALKRHFGMVSWTEWPDEDVRLRKTEALEKYRLALADDIRFFSFLQYQFFRQWDALRAYIHKKGLTVIGDLPIYVALDSADVWSEPGNFMLDERNLPIEVAGVPPDYFTADGQLWGNALYNWERMADDGYNWWIRRVAGAKRLYDILRIDHFRGFESYWCVPYGAKTARKGCWRKGPGMALIGTLRSWFQGAEFIAEDLGFLTPEVRQLLTDSGFPGMKILQFAFDPHELSEYLPHGYTANCICYTGTHDNETLRQWLAGTDEETLAFARAYLGLNEEEGYDWGVIRCGMSSVAQLFVAQMQDYLELGAEGRMNVPGVAEGNWRWRLLPGQASGELAARLRECARRYGRWQAPPEAAAEEETEEVQEAAGQ